MALCENIEKDHLLTELWCEPLQMKFCRLVLERISEVSSLTRS